MVQGTADDVQHAFADNGEFGQEANVSHPVLVTGTIGAVRTTVDGNPYVTFRIAGKSIGPEAMFDKTNPPKARRLAVGEQIKVFCPSLHLVDDSAVLDDCVLR